jgi:pimeloyl-ACP methyl ester carboxylesterase
MTSVAEWKAAGSYFDFKGHEIFFREDGHKEAPALLLVHGFPSASWDYDQIWPELVKKYRVLTLDMLGFGFSDKPQGHDYRIVEQADINEELLRLRGVVDYHLFAHDYGVSVGQELMARDMEGTRTSKILSVALLNGGLFPETHHRIFLQSLLLSRIGPLVSLLATRKSLAKSMRQVFGPKVPPTEAFLDGVWELLCYKHGNRILHKLIHYIPDRIEHRERWVSALQRQDIRVRLIDGTADPISGLHMAKHYRELIPNADVVELEGIGHYPQVQAPKAVLNAYLEFRERVG